jgi:hypothetical protein
MMIIFSGYFILKETKNNIFIWGSCCSIFSLLCKVLQIVVCPFILFMHPSRDGPYYVIGNGGRAGGRPHRFPHNNFSFVYRIFTKLGHMIPLSKGKNPIYCGVIRSKVKVTVTIHIIFDNRVVSAQ